MVKAYANLGAWRASVRDTRLKEVMVRKEATDKMSSKKKRTKKDPLVQKKFFAQMVTL